MRLSAISCLLLSLCISSLAAPPTTQLESSPLESSSVITNSSVASSTRTSSHSHHSLAIPPRPTLPPDGPRPGHFSPLPSRTILTSPSTTNTWRKHRPETARPIAIFFEALGGLIGLIVLLSCIRCCYVYQKTPGRDRIAAVLHHHQLQQELAEIERNRPLTLRRSLTSDPVPPYFPPPPTYEAVASICPPDSSSDQPQRSGYVGVASSCPLQSPRSARRVETVEPPPGAHIPPISNG